MAPSVPSGMEIISNLLATLNRKPDSVEEYEGDLLELPEKDPEEDYTQPAFVINVERAPGLLQARSFDVWRWRLYEGAAVGDRVKFRISSGKGWQSYEIWKIERV